MKKKAVATLSAIVLCVGCIAFSACSDEKETNKQPIPEMKEYSLTEGDGAHVANVPYDEYLDFSAADFGDKTVIDIRDHGASTDKSAAENTTAINEAIRSAAETGAVVKVEGGTYYTGTLYMASGVTLYIAEGSVLKLPDYDDYTAAEKRTILKNALIRAEGADDWSIIGPGKLDGNGTDYTRDSDNPTKNLPQDNFNLKEKVLSYRERLRNRKSEEFGCHIIYAYDCQNIAIENVIVYEPSTWTVKFESCDGVKIEDVVIDNNIYVANSDGIDVCGTSNVEIRHCFIATGDDGIVLKSNVGEIHGVSVSDCEIMSLANNFKIGTETGYDVSDVTVTNCYFFTAEIAGGNSGIAIESADGANVSDVNISGIVMNNVPSAILIWLGCRLDKDNGSKGNVGSIEGVSIKDVYANNVDIASAVVGCEYNGEQYKVKNVTLQDIDIIYRDCEEDLNIYNGNDVMHANMNGYPEITRVSHQYFISHELSPYYDMPVYGLYLYTVENVKAENFNVKPRSCNTRPFTNAGSYDSRDRIVNSSVA